MKTSLPWQPTEAGEEDVTQNGHYAIVTGSILILCALLAVIGNCVIAIVVVKKRLLLQTVTHMFVLNLAVSHLLLCSVCVPFEALMFFLGGHWVGGEVSCKMIQSLKTVFTSASMLTLSAISIDRYYSVVYPLEKKLSPFKAKLMIFWVWVHSIVISLPLIFVYKPSRKRNIVLCYAPQWPNITQARAYFIAYFLLTILGPVLITCMAYIFVWRAFRLSQKRINVMNTLKRPKTAPFMPYASKTEVRLLKMLFIMVFCYLIFWTPFVVYSFQYYFGDRYAISPYFAMTATWVTKLQPVTDPLIYGYLNRTFRQSLNDILHSCACVLWTSRESTTVDRLQGPTIKSGPDTRQKQKGPVTDTGCSSPNLIETGAGKIKGYKISAKYHISAKLKVHDYEFAEKSANTAVQPETSEEEVHPISGLHKQLHDALGIRPINHPKNFRRIMAPVNSTHSNSIPSMLHAATPLVLHTCLPNLQNFSDEPDIGLSTPIQVSKDGGVDAQMKKKANFVELVDSNVSATYASGRCILPPLETSSVPKGNRKKYKKKKPSYRWLKDRKIHGAKPSDTATSDTATLNKQIN